MFASQSASLQAPFTAPLILPYRTSRRVRTPDLSSDAVSVQNTVRWFSQSRLCSTLLKNRAQVEKVLFYTPAVRDELTVQNSCAWPATYDIRHIGVFGSQLLKFSVTNFATAGLSCSSGSRSGSLSSGSSRGFRTKAAIARDTYNDQFEKKANVLGSASVTKTTEDRSQRFKTMLQDNELSTEEQTRLRIAFAEGYRVSDGGQAPKKKWGFFSMTREIVILNIVLATALFLFYGIKFKKVIIGSRNEVSPQEIDVTFDDVMGVEDAKQELQEIVEFLKNPKKFSHLGGKLPKGVLLVGPPGTGKTLLARAVAGEAGVPFFHAAGPEFDELLVGQGARRMRDLFQTAKARAPCVIFIDEIDSVGAARSSSVLHPYANQTINQLLTEMDGFRQNEGVIVLGATNRRDDLDRALLRPGRFDVEVQVPRPDLVGRTNILEYYISKVTVGLDVNINYLARGTTGFTGADIENMVNQAALRAAIDGKDSVTMAYFENARDKLLMGPERRSRIPDKDDNLITAYHEGGHALVAYYSKESLPLHKVTIIARGPSLGHTAFIPSKDDAHLTKSQILAQMDSMMGGRAAEELTFGVEKVTTGASTDLQKATELATNMVKYWGMSDKVGERFFETKRDSLVVVNDISNLTSELIDQEIKRNLHESMERAKTILRTHHNELKLLAEALLKYETLDAKEVKQLLETGTFTR